MLILKEITTETEGEWFDITVRGENIKLKIRPLSSDIISAVRKKHTRKVNEINPISKKMDKVDKVNEEEVGKDLINHIIEDFDGIGTDPNTPLEVTPENKVRIMEIPTLDGEVDLSQFAFDKAKELAAISEKDFKENEKNS